MGRFERTTELDENGVMAIGHTVKDNETGNQEHLGVNGLTLVGRSVPDGDGHSTQMSPNGYTAVGHTDDDDDDSTHTDDEQVMAVGHTDHQPDRDAHTDVDRVSSKGSSMPGGSSGFHQFYNSGSDDESASDSGPRSGGASSSRDSGSDSSGYDDYDDSEQYDDESGSTGCIPLSEEVARRQIAEASGIRERGLKAWEDEKRQLSERIRAQYERGLRALSERGQGNCPESPPPEEEEYEEPEPAPRRRRSTRRSQPCNADAWGWALCAVLGVALVAGTTLALVFGLRNRNESSAHTPASTPTTENDVQKTLEEAAELGFDEIERRLDQLILQRELERAVRQAVSGASAAPAQPVYASPPLASEPRPTARTPRVRSEDVRTHIRHPVTSDVESEIERVRQGLREWNPGLSTQELERRSGLRFGDRGPGQSSDVHSRPIHPAGYEGESERERANRVVREWRAPRLSPEEARGLERQFGPQFDTSRGQKSINNPNSRIQSYEGPKWKVRTEPKREQYVPQPMQNWARQRR